MPGHGFKGFQTGTFNRPINVIGSDVPLPREKPKGTRSAAFLPGMHERPFHPGGSARNRKHIHPEIGPYPEFRPNPPKEKKRVIHPEGYEEKERFKMTHNSKSIPCPSVATNLRNIKSAYAGVFSK